MRGAKANFVHSPLGSENRPVEYGLVPLNFSVLRDRSLYIAWLAVILAGRHREVLLHMGKPWDHFRGQCPCAQQCAVSLNI